MSDSEPWEVVYRPRFFDASAIVKLFIEESGSGKARDALAECKGQADTSWLCIAEAFGVLKRDWLKPKRVRLYHWVWKQKRLSDEAYSAATTQLLGAIKFGRLRAVDIADDRRGSITQVGTNPAGGTLVAYLAEAIELRRKYPHLDVIDVIQFRAIKEGFLKYAAGESEPKLVSADGDLLKAAKAEGIATIDVGHD